ncbi:energy-coupling factor transporter transmembrane protein EcfT, partial [Klebsiella oxytoca]
TITVEGLKTAVTMAIRLTLLIIGSSVMTLTTTPNNLTDGMEKMMKPLKVFHVPVHEVAMIMSIALRFIPILMEETDKIMKA